MQEAKLRQLAVSLENKKSEEIFNTLVSFFDRYEITSKPSAYYFCTVHDTVLVNPPKITDDLISLVNKSETLSEEVNRMRVVKEEPMFCAAVVDEATAVITGCLTFKTEDERDAALWGASLFQDAVCMSLREVIIYR